MRVEQLIELLKELDQKAVINMASDEEGNSYGDISRSLAEGKLLSGRKVYSLYPEDERDPEDIFRFEE